MLDSSRVINGSFGTVVDDGGKWLSNYNKLEASVEADKKELKLSGRLWTAHKIVGLKGTGTVSGFKVDSSMLQRGFKPFQLTTKVDDPEAFGAETIVLHNVIVDKLHLANWEAGTEVTEEVPFTFEGFELKDPIGGGTSIKADILAKLGDLAVALTIKVG